MRFPLCRSIPSTRIPSTTGKHINTHTIGPQTHKQTHILLGHTHTFTYFWTQTSSLLLLHKCVSHCNGADTCIPSTSGKHMNTMYNTMHWAAYDIHTSRHTNTIEAKTQSVVTRTQANAQWSTSTYRQADHTQAYFVGHRYTQAHWQTDK